MTKDKKIGTRGSNLAVTQTQLVLKMLNHIDDSIRFEIVTIKTTGDLDRTKPLFSMDRKGIFEKEINEAVIREEVDFAIHSIKDVPSIIHKDLIISSIPKRESINDVLISKGKKNLNDLSKGSTVGTSSLRRAIQLLQFRNDLNIIPIRGNIDTRIEKTLNGEYDAIVLAEAGIKRLGKQNLISEIFDIKKVVPAAGQGALAIVCKRNNSTLIKFLKRIEHEQSRISINTERAFLSKIESGCRFPIGAFAVSSKRTNKIKFYSKVFSADGSKQIIANFQGRYNNPIKIGYIAAKHIIRNGAESFAVGWDKALDEWNKRK